MDCDSCVYLAGYNGTSTYNGIPTPMWVSYSTCNTCIRNKRYEDHFKQKESKLRLLK